MDMSQIEWIKYLTIVITIFGSYLGYQQYKLNQYKIKLDLYEKRFSVVSGYKKSISKILRNGYLTDDELRDFIISTKESVFRFDESITKHLDDVYEKFVNLQLWKTQLKDNRELEESLSNEYSQNSSDC